ncbi:MAG: amidohydrolase family protein [Bacteroidia bacterium]|nr:amidohydrolase family protein [Bacteroidia bacterium]
MNNTFRLTSLICLLISIQGVIAQSVPTPAPPQEEPIILKNATIHDGKGKVIQGDVLLLNGKIEEVGTVTQTFKRSQTIDCSGKHIYPGLIAPNTDLGLVEVEAVRSTRDVSETGEINPNIRALVAYNTDSRVTPTVKSNGILLAQIVPDGGLISGRSSVVSLDAWNWEDAAYQADEGVHIRWPNLNFRDNPNGPPLDKQKETAEKQLNQMEDALNDAKSYQLAKKSGSLKATDLRWEAMIPLLEGKIPAYVHANTEKQIASALDFQHRHGFKMVLVEGADAHLFLQELKERNIPVILRKTHSLPNHEDDAVDLPYHLPALLYEAGVNFCLSGSGNWDQRNLPFLAGTAAAYGLPKEEALAAITSKTAQILGIDSRTGSIEPGKDANLIVSAGDLLDMRTSVVEMAFFQGRNLDLGNRQKDLYQKFGNRPTGN